VKEFIFAAPASANGARHHIQDVAITAVQPEGAVGQWTNVWTHTHTVTLNSRDGSLPGSGTLNGRFACEHLHASFCGFPDQPSGSSVHLTNRSGRRPGRFV